MKNTTEINTILDERGKNYGEFKTHAEITMMFKRILADYQIEKFDDDQIEALHMIFHKIGRIINGDPNYIDSWIDIAGYAKLVSDRLEKKD
jgi:hypothetical protein